MRCLVHSITALLKCRVISAYASRNQCIFRTGSPSVIRECQQNYNFLPKEWQLEIRTDKFLQAFSATENRLCLLFKEFAVTQLSSIFGKYKPNIIFIAGQLTRILHYNL